MNEPDFFEHEVREIIFHPDWESQSNIHDADIALVVLTETVQFSSNIIKVCLPVSTQTEFLGTGTVVGLVRSNESESFDMDLSQFDLSVVTQSQCLEHEKSATSFCAATSAQSHSQVGDGFLFFNPLTKSYELRGLFSMSINDHSLFTNVGNFVDWIEKKIEESEKVVLEDIEMSCKIYQA